ncbi:hypothetical protein [Nocardia altamirensis]|uniref:hypothetical protein n=1 Tax=Nocardia altamirensis TaxID=472158 RepID=UPI0008408BCF|nr:hypothetical protein [Nocardia altamirensis]
MEDLVPHTAEVQQQHAERQRSPEFLAWLAASDSDLDRLVRDDVPALARLDDPWTVDGLRAIEHAVLDYFPNPRLDPNPEQRNQIDRLARGIGHVYTVTLEGFWVWAEPTPIPGKEAHYGPVVELPSAPVWVDPEGLLAHAADKRSGELIQTAYGHAMDNHLEWVAAGRPSHDAWLKIRAGL